MKTIFVSSTFRDMDAERDAIQQIVSPELNREARQHGQSVSFCDLRWGIDTSALESETGSRKVLDVCLDEIDRCQPPMVVILGYRYGWIPSQNLVQTTARRYALELDNLEKSVTALEIEYGALANPAKCKNTLFYFRHIEGTPTADYLAEDAAHALRLESLKSRIRKMTGGQVWEYTLRWDGNALVGIKTFAQMLCRDLRQLLLPQWQRYDGMTPFQKEIHTHEAYLREKAVAFRARAVLADQVLADIENGQLFTVLQGSVGSGKSTLLSHLCLRLRKQGWDVPVFFSNLTTQTNTAIEILQLMVEYLEEELQQDHFSQDSQHEEELISEETQKLQQSLLGSKQPKESFGIRQWQQRLEQLCALYAKTGRKIVFALDAVDQLYQDDFRDDLVFVPNNLGPQVRFLMTSLPGVNVKGNSVTRIPPVSMEEKHAVIAGILDSHNRELSEQVVEAMIALPASDNPLYLSFLVQRLIMMNQTDFETIRGNGDGMDAITRYQLSILSRCAGNLDAMGAELMDTAAARIGGNMVRRALTYIALAPHGLRTTDLASLLGKDFNMLDFAHFISYMNDCFVIRNDGRYDFSHKSIREGLLQRCEQTRAEHKKLLEHFAALEPEDDVRRQEIAYHCIRADEPAYFAEYIRQIFQADWDAVTYAAKVAYDAALLDDGDWLCCLLSRGEELGADTTLVKFIYAAVAPLSVSRIGELSMFARVLEANLALAKRLEERDNSRDSRLALVYSINLLAACHENIRKKANLERAKELRVQQLEFARSLYEQYATEGFQSMLVQAHRNMSCTLGLGGASSEEARLHLDKAMEYQQELVEKTGADKHRYTLAAIYLEQAEAYTDIIEYNTQLAKEYIEKAEKIYQAFYDADPSIDHMTLLAKVQEALARLYEAIKPDASVAHTLERISIMDSIVRQDSSILRRQQLAAACMAYVTKRDPSVENDRSREFAEKAMKLYRGIVEERGSIYDQRNLARVLKQTASHTSPTPEQKQQVIPLLLEAEIIYRELIEAQDLKKDKQELAEVYQSLSWAYEKLDPALSAAYEQRFDGMSDIYKGNAYAEVLEILRYMDRKFVDMIPQSFVMFLFNNANQAYDFHKTKRIDGEVFLKDTQEILSLINYHFWKQDELPISK